MSGRAASSISVTSYHRGLSVHTAAKGKDDRVELAGRGRSTMRILLWQQAQFPRQSARVKEEIPHPTCRSLQECELAAEGSP